jgi:aryl-alcohol dehydrogenase-like predicted oxidoreductase
MRYRNLGRTGIKVSPYALGALMFATQVGNPDPEDSIRNIAVERLIPLAEEAGLSMPHLAMAFAISHPGVTCALLGARTMEQLDGLAAR